MAAKDEKMSRSECLKVLELDSDANEEQIKKAYKRLALLHHPDKNLNDDSSTQKFQELSDAYYKLTIATDGDQCCPCCGTPRDCWAEAAGGPCGEEQMRFFKQMFYEVLVDFIERRTFQRKKGRKKRTDEELEEEAFLEFIETLQFSVEDYSSYTDTESSSDEWEFTEEELRKFHSYDEWLKDRDPKKRHNHRKRRAMKRTNQTMPTAKPKPLSKKQLQAAEHRRKKEMEEIGKKLIEQQQKLKEQQCKEQRKAEKLKQEREKARAEELKQELELQRLERQRLSERVEAAAREAKLQQCEDRQRMEEKRRKRKEAKQTKKLAQKEAKQQLSSKDTNKWLVEPRNTGETKPKCKELDSDVKVSNNLEAKKKGHSQYVRNLPPRMAALKANQYKPVTKYEEQNNPKKYSPSETEIRNSTASQWPRRPLSAAENGLVNGQCSGEVPGVSTTVQKALSEEHEMMSTSADGKTVTPRSEKYTSIQPTAAPVLEQERYNAAPSLYRPTTGARTNCVTTAPVALPQSSGEATGASCSWGMAEVDHDPSLTSIHLQQYRDIMKLQPERHTQWQLKGAGDCQLQHMELLRRQQEKEARRNRDEMDELQQQHCQSEAIMPARRHPVRVSDKLERSSSHNSTLASGPCGIPNPLPKQPETAWERRVRLLEELTPHSAEQEEAMLRQAMELSLLTEKIQRAEARYQEYTSKETRHMNDLDDFPLLVYPTNDSVPCEATYRENDMSRQDTDQCFSQDCSDDGLPEGAFHEAKPCPNYTRLSPLRETASSAEEASSGSSSQASSGTTSESGSLSEDLSRGRDFSDAKPKYPPQFHSAVISGQPAQSESDVERFEGVNKDGLSGRLTSDLRRNETPVQHFNKSGCQNLKNSENPCGESADCSNIRNGHLEMAAYSTCRKSFDNQGMAGSGVTGNARYWTFQEVENDLTLTSSVEDWSNDLDDDKIWNNVTRACPESPLISGSGKQDDMSGGEIQPQMSDPMESATRGEDISTNRNCSRVADEVNLQTVIQPDYSIPAQVEAVVGATVGKHEAVSSADHTEPDQSPGQEATVAPLSPPVDDLASMSRKIQGTSQIWATQPSAEVDGSGDHAGPAQNLSSEPAQNVLLDPGALPGLPSVLPDSLTVYMQYLAQHTAMAMMSGAGRFPLLPPVPLIPGLGQLPFPGLPPMFPTISPIFAHAMQQRTQAQAAQGFPQNAQAAPNPNYQTNYAENIPQVREDSNLFSQYQPAEYGSSTSVTGQPEIQHCKQQPLNQGYYVNDTDLGIRSSVIPDQNSEQNQTESGVLSLRKPSKTRFFTRINVRSARETTASLESYPDVRPPGLGSTKHLTSQQIPAAANTQQIPAPTISGRDSVLASTQTTEVNCEDTAPRRVAVQSRFCKPLANVHSSDSAIDRRLPPRIPSHRSCDADQRAPVGNSVDSWDEQRNAGGTNQCRPHIPNAVNTNDTKLHMPPMPVPRGADDAVMTAKYRPPIESWEKQRSGQTAKYRPPTPSSRDLRNGYGESYRSQGPASKESWDEELLGVDQTDPPKQNPGKTQRPPAMPRQFLSKGVDARGFNRLARDSNNVTARRQAAPDAFGDCQQRSY